MSAELGHFAIWLACAIAGFQAWAGLRSDAEPQARALAILPQLQLGMMALGFACLLLAFVRSDFSLALVATHSHVLKPLLYRLAGVWGNHEGSMLLWCLILALYGAAFARWTRAPAGFARFALGYMGALNGIFLLYLLLTSNPFARLNPAPFEGQGLNPVLQDPALAAHPPFLYFGLVGFALVFCLSLAFLRAPSTTAKLPPRVFADELHRWLLPAWCCLTIGITLGSVWAYYELGWGGFWFWDPVENASLMPWLAATALLHTTLVLRARGAMLGWVVLLAILTFGLSVFGTFLVRSGVVSSVHSFASDPTRGVALLAILFATGGYALLRYAQYGGRLPRVAHGLRGRVGALLANNVLLGTILLTILVGTLYPLIIEAVAGIRISVGAPYFNIVLAPLAIAILVLIPFAIRAGWTQWHFIAAQWGMPLGLALLVGLLVWWQFRHPVFALLCSVSAWLIVAAFADGWRKPAQYGRALAHGALACLFFGISAVGLLQQEAVWLMTPGEQARLGAFQLRFDGVRQYDGANFQSAQGQFVLERGGQAYPLTPERRFYGVEQSTTTEVAMLARWQGAFYLQLGAPQDEPQGEPQDEPQDEPQGESQGGRPDVFQNNAPSRQWLVRAWYHPFVLFIWLGGLGIALGGAYQAWWRWHHA